MFREGLRSVLAPDSDFHVVGQATSGHDTLSLVRAKQPDVLLLDFGITDPPALAVLRQMEDGVSMPRVVLVPARAGRDEPLFSATVERVVHAVQHEPAAPGSQGGLLVVLEG